MKVSSRRVVIHSTHREKTVSRSRLFWLIAIAVITSGPAAQAQQGSKLPKLGFLSGLSASAISTRLEAFKQGLNELGYTEGKNTVIEYRWAAGKLDRLPELASELVRLNPMSSLPVDRPVFVPRSERQIRFPLSWLLTLTPWVTASSPA